MYSEKTGHRSLEITIWFHISYVALKLCKCKHHFLISRIILHCSSELPLIIRLALNAAPPSKYFLLQVHNRVTTSTVQVALKLSLCLKSRQINFIKSGNLILQFQSDVFHPTHNVMRVSPNVTILVETPGPQ